MSVDVADLLGTDAGIFNGIEHDPVSTATVIGRQGDVKCVAAHPVSNQLRDNCSATFHGEFPFFDNQNTGSFANDKTVSLLIEGSRRAGRFLITSGESAHGGEPADAHGSDRRFRSAAEHDVGFAAGYNAK